jgi:AmiR/NasT family two-component response regulator
MKPKEPIARLRIAAADDERDTRQFFAELLPSLGHEVVVVAQSGRELVEQCRKARPDLVITDIKMPDMDGIQAAAEINREFAVPVILLTAHHEAELIARSEAEHIMAYLVKPVKPVDVQAAISLAMVRFAQFMTLRKEAADLRQTLDDRKLIERAKGAVMKRMQVDEEEAYRRLRKAASKSNKKLIDIGREVVAAEEVFRALENI